MSDSTSEIAGSRLGLGLAAALSLGLFLAGCATHPSRAPHRPGPHESKRTEYPVQPPAPPVPVATLPGWADEDHAAALKAYQATCYVAQDPRDHAVCAAARALGPADEATARAFFETRFEARACGEPGLLTGYFAPEYEAREEPDEEFSAPVRPKPPELVRGADGRFEPWLTRAEIEKSPAQALAFMRPEDLFFMQIQGSGYLEFPDGRRARAAYAADNGRPFTGIARPMTDQGLLPRTATSGEAIRAWLAAHRGPEAEAVTDLDARYIFFAVEPDDGGEPKGAAGVPLIAGRSGAIDTVQHGFGELLWVAADSPVLSGAVPSYRRLVTALDAGGAIKGPVRLDLYLGRGDAAGTEAGRIRHPLKLWRLVAKG
jgi:membrane-bound lytic murein transglycosylase A